MLYLAPSTEWPESPPERPLEPEEEKVDIGYACLYLYYALVAIAIITIIPDYSYTLQFWIDGFRDVAFNFSRW
jgi:hypothetical protein